jgi:protein-S-isoprenylcysteine O-methyltransferase Ste14
MQHNFWQRGGAWVLVQFALMAAMIWLGIAFPGGAGNWGGIAAGLVLITAGGVFGVAGVRVLGRNRTAFPRPREDSELIQHGIYSRVRHPLYTSVMLVSAGWALAWQSWPALAAALALIAFLAAKARHEEHWLRRHFAGYEEYARRVPRFLPRFRL